MMMMVVLMVVVMLMMMKMMTIMQAPHVQCDYDNLFVAGKVRCS